MNKVLLLFFLCISFLNANFIEKTEILIAKDGQVIEDVKKSKDFKKIKIPLARIIKENYFLKIHIDKSKLEDVDYVVEFESVFNDIHVDKTYKEDDTYRNKIITINKKTFSGPIYIHLINKDGYASLFINVKKQKEFVKAQVFESRLFGIANGIIIAAILFYLALYYFNRQKSYILYSLTQLSMLFILIFISGKEFENDRIIVDMIFMFFFISSNLFTKSFLNTKELSPRLDKLLTWIIIFFGIDICLRYTFDIFILEDNIPFSFLLIFYLITALVVYLKGYKPAIFYLIGWSLVIFSFLIIELQMYFFPDEVLIKSIYLINIVSPLETLILAFALSYKMKIQEEEKQEQQQFLAHQSKLASMGEMIGNIAHQWRQPLTHISYIMMNLKTAFIKEKLTQEYFEKKSKEANVQLEFMSNTIDNFRDFFKVTKQKEEFSIASSIDEVINLLSASFNEHNIEIEFLKQKDINIHSLKGELLHVLFNILNNAKDEFINKNIQNPKILISLFKEVKHIKIEISDNAGGIKEEIISKIFEPYFTTKDKGLGIGLYMSKMIMDKSLKGKLHVENIENGAKFTIEV